MFLEFFSQFLSPRCVTRKLAVHLIIMHRRLTLFNPNNSMELINPKDCKISQASDYQYFFTTKNNSFTVESNSALVRLETLKFSTTATRRSVVRQSC
jgi:hypothetical protein